MPSVSKRAPEPSDSSATLKVCPHCLGDLEFRVSDGGGYLACSQCGAIGVPLNDAARRARMTARRHSPLMSADALINRVPS